MTLNEAIKNTMVSSCFIESTDGRLCFHYYNNNFFLNDGRTLNFNNKAEYVECARKDYIIKYGINEINYNVLKELHDKLEKGEFSVNDSFLSAYDASGLSYESEKTIREELNKGEMTTDKLKKMNFTDAGFNAFTIKFFLDSYRKDSKINLLIYGLSFIIIYVVGMIIISDNFSHIGVSISLLIASIGLCCCNDTYNMGMTINAIKQFVFSMVISLAANILLLKYNNVILSMLLLVLGVFIYMQLISDRSKTINKIIKTFNLKVFR